MQLLKIAFINVRIIALLDIFFICDIVFVYTFFSSCMYCIYLLYMRAFCP